MENADAVGAEINSLRVKKNMATVGCSIFSFATLADLVFPVADAIKGASERGLEYLTSNPLTTIVPIALVPLLIGANIKFYQMLVHYAYEYGRAACLRETEEDLLFAQTIIRNFSWIR